MTDEPNERDAAPRVRHLRRLLIPDDLVIILLASVRFAGLAID